MGAFLMTYKNEKEKDIFIGKLLQALSESIEREQKLVEGINYLKGLKGMDDLQKIKKACSYFKEFMTVNKN